MMYPERPEAIAVIPLQPNKQVTFTLAMGSSMVRVQIDEVTGASNMPNLDYYLAKPSIDTDGVADATTVAGDGADAVGGADAA